MEYLDIIIFAALAAFLFMRLWMVFGRKNDDDPQRPNPFAKPDLSGQDEGDVLLLPERLKTPSSSEVTAFGHAVSSLAGGLDRIKEIDNSFDEKEFLKGAKTAFSMIVGAFAKGDLAHVEKLLAPDVANQFSKAAAERISSGRTLDSKIDQVKDAEVVLAVVDDKYAKITVNFVSNQINVLRDNGGNVISGSPNQIEEIHDVWVFGRDLSSENPN